MTDVNLLRRLNASTSTIVVWLREKKDTFIDIIQNDELRNVIRFEKMIQRTNHVCDVSKQEIVYANSNQNERFKALII